MDNLVIDFEHECECGHISHINTEKCNKYICSKCGRIIFGKVEDVLEHYKNIVK